VKEKERGPVGSPSLLPPPRRGFEGTGPFLCSLARRWSQAQLPSFEKVERAGLPFFPLLLVPSSSLLRPRHASPFRRPRSRDYRQRDRSLLACNLHQTNPQTVTSLRSSRCAALSTSPLRGRHMPRVVSWAREIKHESPNPRTEKERKREQGTQSALRELEEEI
jgi:hypothetical protein